MSRSACFNVPTHHRNLWSEYSAETSEVDRVATRGDERAPGFSDAFLPELHHRLYSEAPREVPAEERSRAAAIRGKLHDLAGDLPEFSTLRKVTVRDPMWSGIAATALGESVLNALPTPADRVDADASLATVEGLIALASEDEAVHAALLGHIEQAAGAATRAEDATEGQAAKLDETALRNALRAGIERAHEAIDDAKAALYAIGWSSEVGSPTVKDPAVAVALAKRVRSSPQLRRIVDLAGRLITTARAKRATRCEYARSEVAGVEQTGDFARLLPSELVALSDPTTTACLYRKVIERAALGYKVAGTEKSAKGPVVILIDQSDSMSYGGGASDIWAKAVALALLDAARAENRAFGVVLYNGAVAEARLFPSAQDADPAAILDLVSTAPSGGTEFAPAFEQALSWIGGAGKFRRADIVHITDGSASTARAEEIRGRAKALGVHIYGVGIGAVGSALDAWSDEVVRINDVTADSPAVDLIFDNL